MACIAKLKGCWVGCGRSTVIPRCAIAHLRARLLARARNPLHIHTAARWIPGSRYARSGMTAGYASAISRRVSPEVCILLPSSKTEGAGKTGCLLHPRSRVRFAQNKTAHEHTGQLEHSGLPRAMALRLTSCSPRRTALLPPSPALLIASLTPAPRRPNHTTSPYAQAAHVSRSSRVHRIPPRVRDDREPPLLPGETAQE
jgi:hypothetical protein